MTLYDRHDDELAQHTHNVNRGVELLDQKLGPDWVHLIDLESLDLASSCRCVVGQLFDPDGALLQKIDLNEHMLTVDPEENGQYTVGLDYLGIYAGYGEDEAYGFQLGDGYWYDLTEAWRIKIAQLRADRPKA
jgi:hypothetical protein